MTFSTILALIFTHWHKAVAVAALFAALYNKFSKSKGLNTLVKRINQIEELDRTFSKNTKKSPRAPRRKKV
jgi:hypothetical protein